MPDTNNGLLQAIAAWRDAVGDAYVLTDPAYLTLVGTATFSTTQRVPAVVCPASREEVQACVEIANRCQVPIYPISTGKNWGYGSRVPAQDGSVILDLGRLNRIIDFDEKLAYITVEPGVTFRHACDFLLSKGSRLRLSTTGSTAESSLIGNVVERGIGSGEYVDRFAHACNMEVVLPTGECIRTGFARFPGAHAANVGRWGVGPYVDGIFTQSNLGIVTKMTFWLMPPADFQSVCLFSIDSAARLSDLIDTLQELKFKGICNDTVRLYNDYKRLSGMIQFPLGDGGGEHESYLSRTLMDTVSRALGLSAWFGELQIASATERQGRLQCELIKEVLCDKVDALEFTGEVEQASGNALADDLSHSPVHAGKSKANPFARARTITNAGGLRSVYWRKGTPPASIDPDRDGCGVLWCAPLVPFDGEQIEVVVRCIEQTMLIHRYEPSITLTGVTDRSMVANAVLIYDRYAPGEDERAMLCYNRLVHSLAQEGYYLYRLGIQSMDSLPETTGAYTDFLSRVKTALDPNSILSPGRYIGLGKNFGLDA